MSFLSSLGQILSIGGGIALAPLTGGASIAGGLGLAKAINGIDQNAQANKLEKQNVRPIDTPEGEYYQNEAEANANAKLGLGAQQYTNATQGIERNQEAAQRAAGRVNGGGLASITGILGQTNNAQSTLDAQDEAARERNINTAYTMRNQLAQRKAQAFNWNDKQKFLENASAIRAMKGAAQQNIWGGLQTLGGSAMSAFNGGAMGAANTAGSDVGSAIGSGMSGL